MEITIDLPDQTIRKIKALGVLCGTGLDIESLLLEFVDQSVSSAIMEKIGAANPDSAEVVAPIAIMPKATRTHYAAAQRDASGITDGLGDDDDSDVDKNSSSDESMFIPKRGGVRESDLEEDMSVTDPEHEAKVDAPVIVRAPGNAQPAAEDLFSQLAGLPTPPQVPDPRAAQRKKLLKSKARVSYASQADA